MVPPANANSTSPSSPKPPYPASSQQQQAPAAAAAAASPPSPFARPSSSPTDKKTSFDVGGRGSSDGAGAGAGAAAAASLLRPRPSLGRFSVGRLSLSSRRLAASATEEVANLNSLTMRMGRLLSVRKEEWSGDESIRRRKEEEEGKVRCFLFNLFLATLLSSLASEKTLTLSQNNHKLFLPSPSQSRDGARWPSPMVRRKAFLSEKDEEKEGVKKLTSRFLLLSSNSPQLYSFRGRNLRRHHNFASVYARGTS